jgi:AraC-like DNA-binding protein
VVLDGSTGSLGAKPPPIPPCRMAERWSRGEHLLFWVYAGHASVRLANGEVYPLGAGEGLWVPADTGRSLRTEAESVAIPILIQPGNLTSPVEQVVRFDVPDGWRDWLIQHYVHWFSPVTRRGYTPAEMLEVVSIGGPKRHERTGLGAPPNPPGRILLPRSPSARLVARALMRNPALDHTVEQWATLVSSSPSTLRRDFINDTGLTFARWRARCRLSRAKDLLAAGHDDIGWVAHNVGFSSRNGFTRAFRAEYQHPPSSVAKAADVPTPLRSPRPAAFGDGVQDLLGGQTASSTDARLVPATASPPLKFEDESVLLWTYKGTSWARIGDQEFTRSRGDAIWLIAGHPHETRSAENCIDVPIGSLFAPDMPIRAPLRTSFTPSWDAYLLHCSVASYTMLRPDNYDPLHVLNLFDEQLTAQRATVVPMPDDPVARTAASAFLKNLGTAERPMSTTQKTTLDGAFRRETGMTLSAWQRAARMRIACSLLAEGVKPGSVANRVGYTDLSAFSHAFTRYHGVSPRTFQRGAISK